jgi:uncharacterized protein HemX
LFECNITRSRIVTERLAKDYRGCDQVDFSNHGSNLTKEIKMNTLSKAILITTVIALPALSGKAYSYQQSDNDDGMMTNQQMMGQQMMGQQMMKMREQMQENHALMEKIVAEEDAAKRQAMMRKHMESMQQQMQGMNRMMGDGHMGGMPCEDTDKRMEMMSTRMNMMQMMMEQMMEHQHLVE